jgi:radical SAM superfamily enzyme YgiQ (UPF0313 family)
MPEAMLAITAVPAKFNYKVVILDQRIEKKWKEKLSAYLAKKPLCVGVTSITGEQLKYAIEIIDFVKSISDVPVVFGGPHATLLPEQSVQYKNIDIVAVGEGDYTFYEILECLKNKKDLQCVKGIFYKKNGEIVRTSPREQIKELDTLPDYPYFLANPNKYTALELGEDKFVTMMTSRGCPHRCKFCVVPIFYPFWRGWSVPRVMEKIKKLQQDYGISNFYFQDDNIASNLSRFIELITEISKLDKKIKWGTLGIRADSIERLSDEQLELVYKSGCHDLDIGVETGSGRVNKFINKNEEIETIINSNRRLAKYPIILKYTFVIGLPTETKREREESVDLALRLNKENPHSYSLFFPFTPIAGTDFFNLAVEYGFKKPETLEAWGDLRVEDWLEKYPSWLSKKDIGEIETICFVSYFANKNVAYKFTRPLVKIALWLYNPIAKFRLKNKFFGFCVELKIRKFLFKFL